MKKFIITEEVLVGLLNYLSAKPYNEVKDAIHVLSTLEQLENTVIEENVENDNI